MSWATLDVITFIAAITVQYELLRQTFLFSIMHVNFSVLEAA